MRDMYNIMKLQHLLPVLQAKADELRAEFTRSINNELNREYWAAPFSMMEHGDGFFKMASEHKLWAFLAIRVAKVIELRTRALAGETFEAEVARAAGITLDPVTAMDCTLEDLRAWARDEFRFLSPLPRSTSMSHNITEAQMLQTVLEFNNDRLGMWAMTRDAQLQDTEFLQWRQLEDMRANAKRRQDEAAKALVEQQAEAARKRVKKLVRDVAGPHEKNVDALIGWPSLKDAQRIRNDNLRRYVCRVHEKFVLDDDKIVERKA